MLKSNIKQAACKTECKETKNNLKRVPSPSLEQNEI
jgi:hypothetical protein